jgi:hypothetical protein
VKAVAHSLSYLSRIERGLRAHGEVVRYIQEFDKEESHQNVPYNVWFDYKERLPPNINEEIVLFFPDKGGNFQLARSFVYLQNVLYRILQGYPYDEFKWLRFRGPYNDQKHFPA